MEHSIIFTKFTVHSSCCILCEKAMLPSNLDRRCHLERQRIYLLVLKVFWFHWGYICKTSYRININSILTKKKEGCFDFRLSPNTQMIKPRHGWLEIKSDSTNAVFWPHFLGSTALALIFLRAKLNNSVYSQVSPNQHNYQPELPQTALADMRCLQKYQPVCEKSAFQTCRSFQVLLRALESCAAGSWYVKDGWQAA